VINFSVEARLAAVRKSLKLTELAKARDLAFVEEQYATKFDQLYEEQRSLLDQLNAPDGAEEKR
jgi:hypothetical protein